ncbi:PIN domain-containing protein [Deinococcus sp. YIM 134068]|uniref:PIN domain-containing protein n=1 Tax=Deinococcus lichenicola TaxID=3118910 RepID=UPI002F9561B7
MTTVLVDTDVISYSFKRDPRARPFDAYLESKNVLYSFQTDAELKFWALERGWSAGRRRQLETFLEPYTLIGHDPDISGRWAAVMHEARRAGRRMLAADAWIAATALEVGVPLVTNNAADFAGLGGLDLISFQEDS